MNHITRIIYISLGGTLLWGTNLCAQITPAWTRHLTPAQWKELSYGVVLPRAQGQMPFMDLSRRISTIPLIKTTDRNWIRHKIFYSGLFSNQEKEILLTPAYAQATLGKVVYLHNKHAAFYNQLTNRYAGKYISQEAFEKHQQILQELTHSLQQYYLLQNPEIFASGVFSKQEIQRLQMAPTQPTAYVLTPSELAEFANLPSKQAQQYWTQRHLNTAKEETENLLFQPTDALSPGAFGTYYYAHMRLSYFKLLARVLENASGKRTSAIIRYKVPLHEGEPPLTDAERGGKLLFEAKGDEASLKEFTQNYGPYATAEALAIPYEITLKYGHNALELLGVQEAIRLRNLSPQTCLDEILPKIADLKKQLAQRSNEIPQNNSFYVTYYKLYAQLQIYQTLAAQARFLLHS